MIYLSVEYLLKTLFFLKNLLTYAVFGAYNVDLNGEKIWRIVYGNFD